MKGFMTSLRKTIGRLPARRSHDGDPGEQGQSIVLVALLLIALVGMVGIALDVGFVLVRNAQLSAAIDSAALAGVVELNRNNNERSIAVDRAAEFLHSNNIPAAVITSTFASPVSNPDPAFYTFDKPSATTALGARTFSITATWPVQLFFLRVLGFQDLTIRSHATAAHFPQANIYASRRAETGALSTSNQAIFGPNLCVNFGDPFSSFTDPLATTFRNRWHGDPTDRTYHYRILIPPDYPSDIIRVELFDPDSINQPNNNGGSFTADVVHTANAIAAGMPPVETRSCGTNQKNPCLINTTEDTLVPSPIPSLDQINLWWYARIDENRGTGTAPGNPNQCGEPTSYNAQYNTVTEYDLFYIQRLPDGTVVPTPLTSYFGQSGDMVQTRGGVPRDLTFGSYNHGTDLHWVSPGASQSYDFDPDGDPGTTNLIPAACGSITGGDYDPVTCPGGTQPGPGRGFEISISNHLSNILVDGESGNRYLYLDVTTISGASENGFEIWAGPPDYVNTIASQVNVRNVQVINDPPSHSSLGVTAFGLGHLPMNSTVNYLIDIPLIYLGPEYAGTSVYVSLYDSDAGADPPIIFYLDSIAESDWSLTFSDPPNPDPDGITGRCIIGSCGTQFIDPPYRIDIPTLSPLCTDPTNQAQRNICTPFYGGRLIAKYIGGQDDTYHWNINLSGLPYLIE